MSTLKTSVLISAQNLLSPHLDKINKDLQRLDARIEKSGKSFKNLAPQIRNAGLAMTAFGVGAGIAIKKMTDVANEAAGVGTAFTNFFGSKAPQSLEKLQEATKGTVSELELMKNANQAVLLGIDPDALPQMFEGALAAAQATGAPVSKAIADITTGIGRQSKLILDNLGIIVNAEAANQTYAASIGKTTEALTDQEKKAAFTQATMKALADNAERIGPIQENNAIKMQQASASMANAVRGLGDAMAPAVAAIAGVLQKVADKFNSLSPSTKKFIGIMAIAVTAVALIGGPILTLIGSLGMLAVSWTALSGAVTIAMSSLAALAFPITATIAVLAGLYLWVTKTDTGKKALSVTIKALKGTFDFLVKGVKNAWVMVKAIWNVTEGFRKMVKDAASVAIENFANWFTILADNVSAGITAVKNFASALTDKLVGAAKKAVEWLQKIPIIGTGIKNAMKGAAVTVSAGAALMSPATQSMADGAELVWQEYQTLQSEANVAASELEALESSLNETTGTAYQTKDAIEDLNAAGGAGGLEKTAEEADKVQESIQELEKEYSSAITEINEKIFELENNHKQTMESIRSEMDKVADQVKTLETQYNDSVGNMQSETAGRIVEEQEKINELIERRKELEAQRGETEDAKRKTSIGEDIEKIVADIEKREAALDRVKEKGIVTEEELAEAQRRASLTSLERFIEDQEAKREILDKNFEEKMNQLDLETERLQQQADQETTIFNIKRQDYELTKIAMQTFHDNYIANLGNMQEVTQKTVDNMRKKLEELRSVISQIQALMRAQSSGGSTAARDSRVGGGGTFVPQFAKGGIQRTNSLIEVAEGDRLEAIVPLPDGRSIPVDMKGGGGGNTISINLGGVTVSKEADEDRLVKKIKEELTEAIINSRLQSR